MYKYISCILSIYPLNVYNFLLIISSKMGRVSLKYTIYIVKNTKILNFLLTYLVNHNS